MKHTLLMTVLLGACCAPALAITNAVAPGAVRAPAGHVQQGVIEQAGPGMLRVNDRNYLYSSSTTQVHDRHGKRLASPRLAAGKTVRYTASPDGAQMRMNELWLTD